MTTAEPEKDNYRCPAGKTLGYVCTDGYARKYRIQSAATCTSCVNFGKCTSNNKGRMISRLVLESEREKFEKQYQENRHIFQKRKEKAEHPFGHIKKNLGVQSFLLRGLKGVRAEAGLLALCFNLTRMINILGVKALIEKMNSG
jgi:hypothetical protein